MINRRHVFHCLFVFPVCCGWWVKDINAVQETPNLNSLAEPVRLQADGQFIDMGLLNPNAHASPEVVDLDGDGDRDLVVGDFTGRFAWFENRDTEAAPEYFNRGYLPAGAGEARTPIYCCIASSPRFLDFDNDGILDFISGSYDPGGLYWFRGLGQGKFAKSKKLTDRDGLTLVHHPAEFARAQESDDLQERSASFGSWPAVVDWDNDNDLDILIGSFDGEIWLRLNEGDRANPVFSTQCIRIENSDGPLKVFAHAHPVIADWNRDGLWDLIVGAADGSVVWYENQGVLGLPQFGASETLVRAASPNKNLVQILQVDQVPQPGVRAQLCVTDYNGDGWLDLLVGDYSEIKIQKPLTDEAKAAYARNLQALEHCQQRLNGLQPSAANENQRKLLLDELKRLAQLDRDYFQEVRYASFIWLYSRKIDKQKGPDEDPEFSNLPLAVSIQTETIPGQVDSIRLRVDLTIEPPWYVYAAAIPAGRGQPLTVDLELPTGIESVEDWQRSSPEILPHDPQVEIYRQRATWTKTVRRTPEQKWPNELKVKLAFQACSIKHCLPPISTSQIISLSKEN